VKIYNYLLKQVVTVFLAKVNFNSFINNLSLYSLRKKPFNRCFRRLLLSTLHLMCYETLQFMATKYTRFNKTLRPRQPFALNPHKKTALCSSLFVFLEGNCWETVVIIDKMGRENEIEVINGEK